MKHIAGGAWGFYVSQLFPLDSPHLYGLILGAFILVVIHTIKD